MSGIFRALGNRNFRIWSAGAIISNVGTWMQRIAQDWLVLTQLTPHNATALGVVMALQFGPFLLLLPASGYAADHMDRRRVLMATQLAMGVLALGLGVLTVAGLVRLWQVYGFALLLGCAAAFDAPVRQTFVADLVGEADLSNAVALNSTSFNAARMIGPAVAGVLISAVGTGWMFLINAATFGGVLVSLTLLRTDQFHLFPRARAGRTGFAAGLRYVWHRPDLRAVTLMLFLIGTFGLNSAIFISTMAVQVFHLGAGRFGMLSTTMAVGSVAGALLAARRVRPDFVHLVGGAALFGVGCTLAAIAPRAALFGAALAVMGVSVQTFTTSTNSLMQLSTEPAMRGRVMAIRIAVAMGGTPIGGAHRRLGGRYLRPALGIGRGRDGGIRSRAGRRASPAAAAGCTAGLNHASPHVRQVASMVAAAGLEPARPKGRRF